MTGDYGNGFSVSESDLPKFSENMSFVFDDG